MATKKQNNTTGLKVTFIPATNTRTDKFKLTQLNSGKSIFINGNLDCKVYDFVPLVLDKIECVKSYSLLVDNTQNKYFIFNIDFVGLSFENILDHFKNFK